MAFDKENSPNNGTKNLRATKKTSPAGSQRGGIYVQVAVKVLRLEQKLMRTDDITSVAFTRGILSNIKGKTPDKTMASAVFTNYKKNKWTPFYRPAPGLFGLKEWSKEFKNKVGREHSEEYDEGDNDDDDEDDDDDDDDEDDNEDEANENYNLRPKKSGENSNEPSSEDQPRRITRSCTTMRTDATTIEIGGETENGTQSIMTGYQQRPKRKATEGSLDERLERKASFGFSNAREECNSIELSGPGSQHTCSDQGV
eukprot:gene3296-4150_t